jgi:general secretion pathway protein G
MMRSAKAFSTMELLIVVVILASVAVAVVPKFSQAGINEARMDELCSSLQMLRSQIELYKVQHEGRPPMQTADGSMAVDPKFEQMIYCTDRAGNVKPSEPRARRDDVYTFGPYLERVPENPFNQNRTLVRARGRDDVPVAGEAGWAYVPETGDIYANDGAFHAEL